MTIDGAAAPAVAVQPAGAAGDVVAPGEAGLARRMSLLRPINQLGLIVGVIFGLLLVLSGFSDPLVVHRMLLLSEPDLYLMFAAVMATAVSLLWLLERRRWRTPLGGPLAIERAPVERRHILGALTFGTGWAIAGTCPGPALAMTAGGHVLGGAVVAGLFCGLLLRESVKARAARPVSA